MTAAPRPIVDGVGLEAACLAETAVIYKHSPRCGFSLAALYQVRRFMEAEPAVPVYTIDVVADRDVAREVERRLGVRHESPQVILLKTGVPVWDAAHGGVTAAALAHALRLDR
jgi:bacillithiol system protein YtxJ